MMRPSFAAITEIEDRLDKGLFSVAKSMSTANEIRAKYIVGILWGGIVGGESRGDLSFEQFSKMCMDHGLPKLVGPAMELFAGMFRGREEEKKSPDVSAELPQP